MNDPNLSDPKNHLSMLNTTELKNGLIDRSDIEDKVEHNTYDNHKINDNDFNDTKIHDVQTSNNEDNDKHDNRNSVVETVSNIEKAVPIQKIVKDFEGSDDKAENQDAGDVTINTELPNVNDESPSNLLPSMKLVNIDRSRYRHYGHQSSMNAETLHKIMKESNQKIPKSNPKDDKTSNNAVSPDVEANSIKISNPNSPKEIRNSPGGSDIHSNWRSSNNKMIVDETMNNLLGLPKNEIVWPYSNETLSDLLKLKIEQEKTKQEEMRIDYASTTLQLLNLAKSMNIDSSLIPYLFSGNAKDLRATIHDMKENSSEFVGNMESKKRSYSDYTRPEFKSEGNSAGSKTEQNSKQDSEISSVRQGSTSTLVSPIRSPPKLPTPHRHDESGSGAHSPNYYSHQHSPNMQPTYHNGVYPVYYPPPPPPNQHGIIPGSVTSTTNSNETSVPSAATSTSLGSPYQQKYHIMYGPPPPGTQPYPPPPTFIPQQYHYYVSNQPGQSTSYPSMVPTQSLVPQDKDREDEHSHKKHKANKNINFMISTPKNPPARKYNIPKEK